MEEHRTEELKGEVVSQAPGELKAAKLLSKNQQKKLKKLKIMEEKKHSRRLREKNQKRAEADRKRRERAELKEKLTKEEWLAHVEKSRSVMGSHKQDRDIKKERLRAGLQHGLKIIIDLEFAELMTPGELRSLAHQVMFSYAANAKATTPCSLSLVGCVGTMLEQLERLSGYQNWLVNTHSTSFQEAFSDRKSDLVYLTADSSNVLQTFDKKKIYIIGGLVDRNRNKNATMTKATALGIETAKLPIVEHVKLTSSMVLTVNQVVDIILEYLDKEDWKEALQKAIPQRKLSVAEVKTMPNSPVETGADS